MTDTRTVTWRLFAACADPDVPTDWFFPDQGDSATAAKAKAVCATCPAIRACLQDAIDTREVHGIRGGLTPKARRGLRVAARPAGAAGFGPVAGVTRKPIDHGTSAGWMAHYRRGEIPCDDCKDARNAVQAQRKRTRRLQVVA